MDLKIASLNVRGIGNNTKRREVFNWLRSKKFSIYMLQEVHCSENTADLWACEWGYKTLFGCCSSNKAGVSILFNNNFNLHILKVFSDIFLHFFWTCQKTSKIWKSVMEWLQNMNIIQNNFTLLNTTALGLKPDTSKYALQIILLFTASTISHLACQNKRNFTPL